MNTDYSFFPDLAVCSTQADLTGADPFNEHHADKRVIFQSDQTQHNNNPKQFK